MGCHLGQGYLYGRPTAAEDIDRLLDEQDALARSATPPLPSPRRPRQPIG
jgi:hypothetical protein